MAGSRRFGMRVCAALGLLGAATLSGVTGSAAQAAAVRSVTPVPLVAGADGRSYIADVSDTDPAKLLVTVDPAPPAVSGAYVVDAGTNASSTVAEVGGGGLVSGNAISGNGRYVAYDTAPNDLFDTGYQGFTKDMQSGAVTPVTVSSEEVPANSLASAIDISDDGRYVLFFSDADNLVAGETGPLEQPDLDVFLRDTVAGTTVAVSDVVTDSFQYCLPASMSADAATIVYSCVVSSGDFANTFVYNRAAGTRSELPSPAGAAYDGSVVSDDGSAIALVSTTVPYSFTSQQQLSIRRTASGLTTRVPFEFGPEDLLIGLELSDDARRVLFEVASYDIAQPDAPPTTDVYEYDLLTGATSWVSEQLPGTSVGAHLGAGNRVYFSSTSELPGATNPSDAYVVQVVPFVKPPAVSAPSGFVPVASTRVASNVRVGPQGSASIDLSGFVPAGTTAVAVNVTLAGITNRTYVSVCAGGTPRADCLATSTVNPYPGRDVANLSFPQLASDRALQIYNNEGSVIAFVDLVGYFTANGSPLDFTPVSPARDTQAPRLGPRGSALITLDGPPAGATAAAIRVTAAGVTGNTYISACPAAVDVVGCSAVSTVNPQRQDTSNLTVVPIPVGSGNQVRLYNNAGEATLLVDVVGWFTPAGTGSQYVATPPRRVQSRDALGPKGTVTRSFTSDLPATATAVAANVTTAGNTAVSYVSVCPAGTALSTCTTSSTVNPYPGQDTASSTLARLGAGRDLLYFNNLGNTLLFTDIQGYFVPRP